MLGQNHRPNNDQNKTAGNLRALICGEAFKRIQLMMRKPQVARTPFGRFMTTTQDAFNHPVVGRALAPLLLRMLGAEPEVAKILYSDDELARTVRMSFDELAEEALAVKTR